MHGMKRTIGRLAAVGAVALALAGTAAAPAAARGNILKEIDRCEAMGGDWYVYSYWNVEAVYCQFVMDVTTGADAN